MRSQLWNAAAVVLSAVLASIFVVLLSPDSEVVEFLLWLAFFAAAFWLLDRVVHGDRR